MIDSHKNYSNDCVRLFVAVEVPSYIKEEMIRLQKSLMERRILMGNYSRPDVMHLTLKFIGDIKRSKIPLVQQALRLVESMPMRVRITKLSFFESFHVPKVVYVALDCPGLLNLVGTVNDIIKELSATKENGFIPHITLVRVKEIIDVQGFMDWIEHTCVEQLSFEVDSFVLMQSKLNSSGPVHTLIERYILKS